MFNWYFASGDLDFFWREQILHLSWLPNVFRRDLGLGQSGLMSLWLDYPFRLVLKILSSIGFQWFVIEKILWLSVFILAAFSSYSLANYIFKSKLSSWIASFIYIANTYFLLLFSGGQLGVAFAYAFATFVLFRFIQILDTQKPKIKTALFNGLSFALLVIFDLRLAYLTFGIVVLYMVWKKTFHFFHMGFSLLIAGFLHMFWILPTMMTHTGPSAVGEEFTNPGMLLFLSFADFSHTVSFLHPNWPENLFGKVYFLQPEFLLIPVLAFGALLWIQYKKENGGKILFFAIVALIGAFLAKGVNPPLGYLFQWCFAHIPGFIMFRDPTKFYLLTAIGYSILIPFTLSQISLRFTKKKRIIYLLFVVCWVISIRAVFTREVKGNFHPLSLPQEYTILKDQLVNDAVPSRTLWIPQKENFAYFSENHPVLQLSQVFKNASLADLPTLATDAAFLSTLSEAGVKYIIVPKDNEGKLFMSDYVYDDALRQKSITALEKTKLIKDTPYREIAVFENPEFTGMSLVIPATAIVQQHFANIGTGISAVALIVTFILICF